MINTLYIDDFLNTFSSNRAIDKDQIMTEVMLIALIVSYKEAAKNLKPVLEKKVQSYLQIGKNFNLNKADEIIREEVGSDYLKETVERNAIKINADYLAYQIKNINEAEKRKLFNKFPLLEDQFIPTPKRD